MPYCVKELQKAGQDKHNYGRSLERAGRRIQLGDLIMSQFPFPLPVHMPISSGNKQETGRIYLG